MIKLGITGNIASGKSLVQKMLEQQGIPVIDSDALVHDLLSNSSEVINLVSQIFAPASVLDSAGGVDRKLVGSIVFKDRAKLAELEKILHPRVKERIEQFFAENQGREVAAAVVPLLYETGWHTMFDRIALVYTDADTQLKRLLKRDCLCEEDALRRMSSQMPIEEKLQRADFVIKNVADEQSLLENVQSFLKELLQD